VVVPQQHSGQALNHNSKIKGLYPVTSTWRDKVGKIISSILHQHSGKTLNHTHDQGLETCHWHQERDNVKKYQQKVVVLHQHSGKILSHNPKIKG